MEDDSEKCCCCRVCSAECRMKNMSLKHQPIEDFFKCQWQRSEKSITWLIYRWFLAIYFICAVSYSLSLLFSNGLWFIYFTNWGFLLCVGMTSYSAILHSIYYRHPGAFSDDSKAIKFYWAFHWTTLVLSLLITFGYWTLILTLLLTNISNYTTIGIMKLIDRGLADICSKHGANTIIMLTDQMLVAFPSRLIHAVFPICFGFVYLFFTYIYYLSGGADRFGNRWVYPFLDWDLPLVVLAAIVVILLLIVLFSFLCFGVFKLRVKLYSKWHRPPSI